MKKSILISESLILDADLVLKYGRSLRIKIYSRQILDASDDFIQKNVRPFTKEFRFFVVSHICEAIGLLYKRLHGLKMIYRKIPND